MELTESDVRAVIASLAGSTLGLPTEEADSLDERTRIEEDLGADSLDLTELATQVSRFFRLYETGLEDELLRCRSVGDWTRTVLRSWSLSEKPRIAFLTSGSTGEPKECVHDWASLVQEVAALGRLFPDIIRVLGTVPRHHIYGFLWTVLLPRHLGVPFVESRERMPAGLIGSLRPGELLVSFPLPWRQMFETGLEFPAGVQGVNSTGPCPPGLISGLLQRSLERMVEVYGSSETGGIGWREDPSEPYRLLPHWTLSDGGESLVRQLPDGSPGERIPAPDHLVPAPGGFTLGGRRDHAVQVGGVNVFPERIAETIRSHPHVADCEVRLMRPDEGGRLKAFVVLEEPEDVAREAHGDVLQKRQGGQEHRELERWLRQTLSAPERPVALTFGLDMPRNEQGKISDWH